MLRLRAVGLLALVLGVLVSFGATADDWVAVKLRGAVFAFVDGAWVQLHRGDVVSDDRVIRTQPSGRATFARGAETIDLGPSTQIQIFDQSGKRFTTVRQFYGFVEVEAEVQNVQHFGVRTPYLAAVVKGTKFTVESDSDSSGVSVMRGKVAVENLSTRKSVLLTAGQSIDSVAFVLMGANGVPVTPGPSDLPAELFADLGGGDPTVLDELLNGGGNDPPGLGLGLGGGNGLGLGGGGLDLDIGLGAGGSGVDLGVGAGGVGIELGVGAGGLDVGVGAGGAVLGVGAGAGGLTVTTPLGGISVPLGGLL